MNKKVGLVIFLWMFVIGLLVLTPSLSGASMHAPGLLVSLGTPGQYSTSFGAVQPGVLAPANLGDLGSSELFFHLDIAAHGRLDALNAEPLLEDANFSTLPYTDLEVWEPNPPLVTDIQKWVDVPDNDLRWILVGNRTPHQTVSRIHTKVYPSHAQCPSQGSEYFRSFITDSG